MRLEKDCAGGAVRAVVIFIHLEPAVQGGFELAR